MDVINLHPHRFTMRQQPRAIRILPDRAEQDGTPAKAHQFLRDIIGHAARYARDPTRDIVALFHGAVCFAYDIPQY